MCEMSALTQTVRHGRHSGALDLAVSCLWSKNGRCFQGNSSFLEGRVSYVGMERKRRGEIELEAEFEN